MNNSKASDIISIAKSYLRTLEQKASGNELAAFFAPEVTQIEFPNRLTPDGAQRDLQELLVACERGKKVLRGQRFEVLSEMSVGNTVVLEVLWTGVLAVPLGKLQAGDEMQAHIATFIEFEDGKIIRQRNYDCFEAF